MADDVPMRIASASKLLSSIMALQCVSRGEVTLDQSLEELLPEVASLQVLTSFDADDAPVQRPPSTPVTLRHLLAHTSGVEYAFFNPLLARYRTDQGKAVGQEYDNLDDNFGYPLIYDPGTAWSYGPNLDWATRLISRASKMDAETYLQTHLAGPLGIKPWEMTFNLLDHPEAHARHADVILRDWDGSLSVDKTVRYWSTVNEPSGGQGIFCTTGAYMKVLHSILLNDAKLLPPPTRDLLFQPSLSTAAESNLNAFFTDFKDTHIGEPVPAETRKSFGFGGLLAMEDCDRTDPESFRRSGSLSWAGVTNIFWNIDPEAGICTLWAFHLKPFGDQICLELGRKFERAVYQMAREHIGGCHSGRKMV